MFVSENTNDARISCRSSSVTGQWSNCPSSSLSRSSVSTISSIRFGVAFSSDREAASTLSASSRLDSIIFLAAFSSSAQSCSPAAPILNAVSCISAIFLSEK